MLPVPSHWYGKDIGTKRGHKSASECTNLVFKEQEKAKTRDRYDIYIETRRVRECKAEEPIIASIVGLLSLFLSESLVSDVWIAI